VKISSMGQGSSKLTYEVLVQYKVGMDEAGGSVREDGDMILFVSKTGLTLATSRSSLISPGGEMQITE
jgi:hypothetical protein